MIGLLVGVAVAATTAETSKETARYLIERHARANQVASILGSKNASMRGLGFLYQQAGLESDELNVFLATVLPGQPTAGIDVAIGGGIDLGDHTPVLQSGQHEPGLLGLTSRVDAWGHVHDFEAFLTPSLRWGTGTEGGLDLALLGGWAGYHTPSWRIGFGVEDRWFGPGRHGGLMLTDNARPAPMGSVAGEHQFKGTNVRVRAEVGAGWLDAPRDDVERPGWLLMDLRLSPIPMLELGATRTAIFGGEGRPTPQFGQLLLPTKPHIENDPEQRLPDQDEMAAFDARLTLPLARWIDGVGVDYLELYGQYGGEDVVKRDLGFLPIPALAGIANLWGAEAGVGVWTANIEWARVMDDGFRWYTGHRIYHAGFTQEGRVMGHPSGGDSTSWNAAVRWMPGDWGVELDGMLSERVGVVDLARGRLRTLMVSEELRSIGLKGWWFQWGRWVHGGVSLARVRNVEFRPGQHDWQWRLFIGR